MAPISVADASSGGQRQRAKANGRETVSRTNSRVAIGNTRAPVKPHGGPIKAAFLLGRGMSARQRNGLGFMNGTTPCHATLTETMRAIDARALADILGALDLAEGNDARHIAIDGKTMRASKDREGKAVHILSAFCGGLQKVLGHAASRGKGMEIPDALKLLQQLDLTGKIVTGDAMFCQKSITAKIVERGGDYILPVKDNQKNLREDIETAFNEPVFPPVEVWPHWITRPGASPAARAGTIEDRKAAMTLDRPTQLHRIGRAVAAMLAVMAASAPARAGEVVDMRYDVEIAGTRVMDIGYRLDLDKTGYQSALNAQSRGVLDMFSSLDLDMKGEGRIDAGALTPHSFVLGKSSKGKDKEIKVTWQADRLPVASRSFTMQSDRVKAVAAHLSRGMPDPLTALLKARRPGRARNRAEARSGCSMARRSMTSPFPSTSPTVFPPRTAGSIAGRRSSASSPTARWPACRRTS